MSNINEVISAFRTINSAMSKAESYGGRGWFPPDGLHECLVEDATFEVKKLKFTVNKEEREIPAVCVGFSYRLTNDPESQGPARSFQDKVHVLPLDASLYVPEEGKKGNRFTIERDRLCRTIGTFLGMELDDIRADVAGFAQAAYTRVMNKDQPLIVKFKAENRKYKKKDGTDATDSSGYAAELLSK